MDLTVVIPVYNEQEIISHVVHDWERKLEELKIDYEICLYNDGSRDNTLAVLQNITKNNKRLKVIDKKNSGHGPTILRGYNEANGTWIFQVDSDNEMTSESFEKLWRVKENYDFLIGIRANRYSPTARKIITTISRLIVKIFYGSGVTDVNSPYRLYYKAVFKEAFQKLPYNTFAPNVILSGYACLKKLRIYEIPINCQIRKTGEVSIKKFKLLKAAIKSFYQTIKARFLF